MRRIPDLKTKIDFVEGVSEFRALRTRFEAEARERLNSDKVKARLRSALQKKSYARELGVHEAQWTRIKKGENPIKDHQLSTLASYLDLDDFGGAEIWTLPLEEFKDVLKRKGYGKLAATGGIADLPARLRALAGALPAVRIVVLDKSATRGIGDPDDPMGMPVLAVGQRARVEISNCPFDGFAVALSEDPNRRLVLLGGKDGVIWKISRDTTLALPSRDASYPVGKPLGRHSLYVVLFAARPNLSTAPTTTDAPTGPLSLGGTAALAEALSQASDTVRVALLDYRVE
jgi:hypothetical protein